MEMSELISGNVYATICIVVSFILFVLSVKLKTDKTQEVNAKSNNNSSFSESQDIEIKTKG